MFRKFREWLYKKRGAAIVPVKIPKYSKKSDDYKVTLAALTAITEDVEETSMQSPQLLLICNEVDKEDLKNAEFLDLTAGTVPAIVGLLFHETPVIGSAYSTATKYKNRYKDMTIEISFRPVLIYGFTKYGFLIYDPAHPFRMFVKDEEIEGMFAEYTYLKRKKNRI